VLSEKIRAASQRSKIRDLHDLSQAVNTKFDRELMRSLAVIKLWESDKENLDYNQFAKQVEGGEDYDLNDLKNLLRKDEQPDLKTMISRVKDNYRWLGQMTNLEKKITQDSKRLCKEEIAKLRAEAAKRAK
jgi:nucleotidyltransferase AbiEii toxin of type IV toxin-antitoxin system